MSKAAQAAGANPLRTPLIGREASPGDNKGHLWMETNYFTC